MPAVIGAVLGPAVAFGCVMDHCEVVGWLEGDRAPWVVRGDTVGEVGPAPLGLRPRLVPVPLAGVVPLELGMKDRSGTGYVANGELMREI